MSRGMFGPDVPASVTMEELRQLVDGIRFVERMRANPVDKDAIALDMAPLAGHLHQEPGGQGAAACGYRPHRSAPRREETRHRHSGRASSRFCRSCPEEKSREG